MISWYLESILVSWKWKSSLKWQLKQLVKNRNRIKKNADEFATYTLKHRNLFFRINYQSDSDWSKSIFQNDLSILIGFVITFVLNFSIWTIAISHLHPFDYFLDWKESAKHHFSWNFSIDEFVLELFLEMDSSCFLHS